MGFWSSFKNKLKSFFIERPKKILGMTLGVPLYYITKAYTIEHNRNKPSLVLTEKTKSILSSFLSPSVDLSKVRIVEKAFVPRKNAAITFGNEIFIGSTIDQTNVDHLVLLLHELIHTEQSKRFGGEFIFAAQYGYASIRGMPSPYKSNYLEQEAYRRSEEARSSFDAAFKKSLPPSCLLLSYEEITDYNEMHFKVEYDSKNYLEKINTINQNDNGSRSREFMTDEFGRIVQVKDYNFKGTEWQLRVYSYNWKGYVIEKNTYVENKLVK